MELLHDSLMAVYGYIAFVLNCQKRSFRYRENALVIRKQKSLSFS
jgi:hypothetical protein